MTLTFFDSGGATVNEKLVRYAGAFLALAFGCAGAEAPGFKIAKNIP